MFHTQDRREPRSRWTSWASRLHHEAMLPWGTKPFGSPPSKSSPYRAEMLQGKGTGRVGMTLIGFAILLSWSTQLDVWIQEQAICSIF